MRYPILPVGAFIAAFLVLIPAFWHWRAGNVPIVSLIVWLFTLNVVYGANSLAWSNNTWDKAPIWCNISTKLVIGASTALPACTICICKYLAMVGGNRIVGLDRKDRRRIVLFDFGFCWGIPIIFMALHYVVQGHRYNIIQYIGCQPTTYISTPGIFIVWLPPLLLSVGTFVYAGIALYRFVQMRVIFSSILQASDSPMSTNRYMRLIAMSVTLVLWGTVLMSVTIWANASRGLRPWVSWEHVHSKWNHADVFIWTLMSPKSRSLALLSWWTIPVSSVILFIFLGFGEDALSEYRRVGSAIMNRTAPRVPPEGNEKFGKWMSLSSPSPSSSSPKNLPLYFPNFFYVTSPMATRATEKTSKLRELILPFPALARTETASKPRVKSTLSKLDSMSSLKPSRPAIHSRTTHSAFYFHPTTSHSPSTHSELGRFSMSDDHLAFGQVYGPSTPVSVGASVTNKTSHELPAIQPLQSLHSMMEFSHSKSPSRSPVKSNERRWSARSKKLRPPPLDLTAGRLRDRASGMRAVTIAEPREALVKGQYR